MRYRTLKNIILPALLILLFLPIISFGQSEATFEMARTRFKQGITLFNNYSYLGAIEFFRNALSVYPEYHQAREYLARAYRLAGYTDEALTEWQYLFDISRDAAVQNKIDMLRYHRVQSMQQPLPPEYTHVRTLESRDLKSYHFRYPTDIVVDRNKMIYVVSYNSGRIVKIDDKGKGLRTFKPAADSRIFSIDMENDTLLFSDFANDRIYCTDSNFNANFIFGESGSGNGQFHGPQGVCFDEQMGIYVVDSGNHRIQKFSKDGSYILQFGTKGNYEGELLNPTDVAVDGEFVYITDTGNRRISVFDTSGNFITHITDDNLQSPRGLVSQNGELLISDSSSGLIVYNIKTESRVYFSSWNEDSSKFSRLYSSVYDRDGFLYSLDHDKESVAIFSPVEKRYTNLDIEIKSVDVSKFPTVAFYVSVRDRSGKPVYALRPEEFFVTEDSARIQKVSIDYLHERKLKSTMVFCVDRSEPMQNWSDELIWSADFILKEMKRSDSVKVLDFTDDYSVASDYDWSRRRLLKSLRDGTFGEGKQIGRVLYNAITDLLKTDSKRAVVLFTDGIVNETSFEQYSENVIIDYARCHYIPVYIVSLSQNSEVLKDICDKTGGMFIEARKVSDLQRIYSDIRNQEEYRYVVVYNSFKESFYSGWWSNVSIEVESKGESGIEWGGYYIP
ncbi:MAG: VWA domain-containing protein [Spirochaetes bacterium]|jgi:DNA-binding beta-propeller fold protein YncE|nr:VWA domain-containing protein [Spirochaetota bacterium]